MYFDIDKFNYRESLKNRADMLNDNVITIEEAIKFLKEQPKESIWGVRPAEDLKKFSGEVMKARECYNLLLAARSEVDLCQQQDTEKFFADTRPEIVVFAKAFRID